MLGHAVAPSAGCSAEVCTQTRCLDPVPSQLPTASGLAQADEHFSRTHWGCGYWDLFPSLLIPGTPLPAFSFFHSVLWLLFCKFIIKLLSLVAEKQEVLNL